MQTQNKNGVTVDSFLKKENTFAVVGASKNPEKYGHQVFVDLKNSGYKVYPINPNANKVTGEKCYPKLSKLPEQPDVVNIVVPPKVTLKIVKQCLKLEINKVWMQPGSESKQAIQFCKENDIELIQGVCVMNFKQD